MTHHSMGHPNLIVIALLPVLLLLLDEILIRQRWRARTAGLALGLVAAAQYSISSELLADAVMLAVVGIPALALWRSELVRERVKYVARALAWSLLAFLVLVGYPIWMVLAGPGHLTGPLVSLAAADKYRSDLLGAVLPTRVELLSLGSLGAQGSRFAVNLAENATYIGVPLLALVAGLTIAFRRDTRLRFASLAALSCYVVSLGSTLDINGDATSLALPYRILEHIPLLDSALAVRFSVFGYLFVALALALGLDHLSRKRELARPPLVAGLLGVVALVPLVPRTLPLAARSYAVPAFFSSAHALDTIPSGSPILVYPYSTDGYLSYSVLWQAVAAFRFKLTSGDVTYRGPHGGAAPEGPPLNPPLLENLLLYAFDGRDAAEARGNLALRPGSLAQIRLALARYHFTTVVAAPVGDHPSVVVATLTRALRRAPIRREGVLVWYGVQHDLRAIGAT
jgi:hypothetical protein